MAVLNGYMPNTAFGGLLDPNISSNLHAFELDWWPPHDDDTEATPILALVTHWPVEQAARELPGYRTRDYADDLYNRVHIYPQLVALGNVVSTQTTPIAVWNAWLVDRTLVSINGLAEGLQVSGQASPPLLVPALAELAWQLAVTPDGQPVLDTQVSWAFDNGASASLRVTANRIIAWTFVPDWGDSIIERLGASTNILQSETAVEQRRAMRLGLRRQFEANMFAEGRERRLLDMSLFGWGGRVWALPIWPDIQLLKVDISAGTQWIPCEPEYLDFTEGGLALLRGEDAFTYEVVEVESIESDGLALARATQQAWRRGTRLYPVRTAQLTEQPNLKRLTDQLQSAQVSFLLMEPCDWPELMPAANYLGWPVLDDRPDESEDLTSGFARVLLTLDSGMALPRVTDTAKRALPMTGYRWVEMGRAARAGLRSLAAALRGQQKAVWVPTHADDLRLVAGVTELASTLDIEAIGYTRFGQARPGRRDIRIELYGGQVFYRRILNCTELSSDIERLVIDQPLGQVVELHQVMRICWMVLSRNSSDEIELEHITDSEGLASASIVFKGVRDDEF